MEEILNSLYADRLNLKLRHKSYQGNIRIIYSTEITLDEYKLINNL